eukprot:TRINITY_DN2106_c0_g1_i3.p3 TRINITY_DN2106_c0_g1~~TRINITY_DN2106_c0_g1_i3.p3  ORF type:complete len:112 (+),score=30.06 TRINITY_DN2106_c0_g1_i3:388-723(+)
MNTLGFETYIDILRLYLQKYREATKSAEKGENVGGGGGGGGGEGKGKGRNEEDMDEDEDDDDYSNDGYDDDGDGKKKSEDGQRPVWFPLSVFVCFVCLFLCFSQRLYFMIT